MKLIIEKYLLGTSSELEQKRLLDWLRVEKNLKEFQRFKEEWSENAAIRELPVPYQKSLAKLQHHMLNETHAKLQKSKRHLSFLRYVAIILFIVSLSGLSWYFVSTSQRTPLIYTTVIAEYGHVSRVLLPDSSVIWINSGSSVQYSHQFGIKNRDITLNGEAFFDVTHNEKLPFTVNCSEMRVTVLGTKFCVSNHLQHQDIKVVLEKGKVVINFPGEHLGFYTIKPGELASYSKSNKSLTVKNVNTNLYTSWKDGIINMYNLPLEEVVKKLEKRYNQKFVVEEKIKKIHYTFTIKNEPLSDVLELMEKITPVKVVQKGDSIMLTYMER